MFPIVLALLSSLLWGIADVLAGVRSRELHVLVVGAVIQTVGLIAVVALALVSGALFRIGTWDADAISAALLAGIFGAGSIGFYYKAMSVGLISLASPLLACGAVLAFVLAVIAGERPPSVAWLGLVLAISGALVVSRSESETGIGRRDNVVYALLAAACLGLYLFLLGQASDSIGGLSAALLTRTSSFVILSSSALFAHLNLRLAWPSLASLIIIGVLNTFALVLFGIAADIGIISISSVLSSLYPVVTVVLAHVFLAERLSRQQLAGVVLAISGVLLVTIA
jgi:drug/metabolite transporter (DMT)-like permease